MEAKQYWEDEIEPAILRAEQSLEERLEQTADTREHLLEQLGANVRRIRDEIQARIRG